MQRLFYCVAHPLTRRCNSFVSFIVAQLSLKPFENGLLVVTAVAAFVRPYRTNNRQGGVFMAARPGLLQIKVA